MILVDGSTYVIRDKVTAITRDVNGSAIFWVGDKSYLSVHSFEVAIEIYNTSQHSEGFQAFRKIDTGQHENQWHQEPG